MTGRTSYGVDARSYLLRAHARLQEPDPEALFYTAFELCCAIEARQDEYIHAQKQYMKSVPRIWKIGDQGSALEAVSDSSRIQHLAITLADGESFDVHHVPVTAELRKNAARLKDFLHAQEKWRGHNDPWWHGSRLRLVKVYQAAWMCCQGRLLSPVFLHDGNVIGNFIMEVNADAKDRVSLLGTGKTIAVTVDYLDRPPPSWVPDIAE